MLRETSHDQCDHELGHEWQKNQHPAETPPDHYPIQKDERSDKGQSDESGPPPRYHKGQFIQFLGDRVPPDFRAPYKRKRLAAGGAQQ